VMLVTWDRHVAARRRERRESVRQLVAAP